jgi:hypothetical protein
MHPILDFSFSSISYIGFSILRAGSSRKRKDLQDIRLFANPSLPTCGWRALTLEIPAFHNQLLMVPKMRQSCPSDVLPLANVTNFRLLPASSCQV